MAGSTSNGGRGHSRPAAAQTPFDLLDSLNPRRRSAEELGIDSAALQAFARRTGPFAVVDLETTGLPHDRESELLEFGAVLVEPGESVFTTLECLVAPRGSIPKIVQRLTGLTDADVADAPRVEKIAPAIALALADCTLIAHNADFERYFLSTFVSPDLDKATYLDTQDLLCIAYPDAPDMRLETFTRDLLDTEERHRALSDALDTLRVISRAAVGARRGERRYVTAHNAIETYSRQSPWASLLEGGDFASSPEPPAQFVRIPKSDEAQVPFDPDAIAAVLADEERGRRHFPGYRAREQQIEMAREFALALADGGRLLLEGGTGVGKSLAYLAAAIPFAMERADGGIREPILISTRTKLLQDQLLDKDIPAAAAMLGYPELRALSIKGRANYVCERRLEQVLAEGREPSIFDEERYAYAALAACARTRPYGEVSTLPGAMLVRFPTLRDLVRRSVAVRAEQCTREQCGSERNCPFGRRRKALASAHLVVANHDLLLRWPPDYPNFTCAIVDESHDLAGVADEVYAVEVRPDQVLERLDDLFGRPAAAGRRRAESLLPRGLVREYARDVAAWRRGVHLDLVELGRSLGARASEFGELQLPANAERIFPGPTELATTAAARLDQVADAATRIAAEGDDEERTDAVERAIADLRDAADGLRGAFTSENDDAVAAFEGLDAPFDRWRLVVRQVAPAHLFHSRFVQKLETLACVSASLFVVGDPFAALGELEIEERSELPSWRVTVDSPFPYREHMRVVALQSSGELVEETADVLADLARALGGRVLGLFTSLRRMNQVGDLLSEKLRGEGFDILAPRRARDDPAALVKRFKASKGGAILLGARTFWQGLDLPGPALQAVVIEKLPFEVPTELRKRRAARIEANGDRSFDRYTLGKMLLNLKQMSGRLIRSEEDRGIVVIVEGRTDKRYFSRLSDALPRGCEVVAATREELTTYLAEVGLPENER